MNLQHVIAWLENGCNVTDAIAELKAMQAKAAQIEQAEPVAWLVFDEDGLPEHATIDRQMAHDHINDAIQEFDFMDAGKWVVRPVYLRPAQPASECDTPHYCKSVQRCTAMDESRAAPVQPKTCDAGTMCLQCPDRDANEDYKRGFHDGAEEFKELYEVQPKAEPLTLSKHYARS